MLISLTVLLSLISAISFFKSELFHLLINLTLIEKILLLTIFSLCSIVFRSQLVGSVNVVIQKIKNLNLRTYTRKISKWTRKKDPDEIERFIIGLFERKALLTMGFLIVSMGGCSHYPKSFMNSDAILAFLVLLTIYSLLKLASSKKVFLFIAIFYMLPALMPYIIIVLGHDAVIAFYQGLPPDLIYWLDIDPHNSVQAANKLFPILISPLVLVILILFILTNITKYLLKLSSNLLLKARGVLRLLLLWNAKRERQIAMQCDRPLVN